MSNATNCILFVGVGSPHGDDRAGWLVADALAADAPPGVSIRKASVPMNLLDWLDGIAFLAVCDACRGGGPAGMVQRFDWTGSAEPRNTPVIPALARLRTSGSHAFGLSTVLELAQRLGRLPRRVVVWGIEGQTFEPGDDLSPQVQCGVPAMATAIRGELSQATAARAGGRGGRTHQAEVGSIDVFPSN